MAEQSERTGDDHIDLALGTVHHALSALHRIGTGWIGIRRMLAITDNAMQQALRIQRDTFSAALCEADRQIRIAREAIGLGKGPETDLSRMRVRSTDERKG